MKRILLVLIIMTLSLSLIACQSSDQPKDQASPLSAEQTTAEESITEESTDDGISTDSSQSDESTPKAEAAEAFIFEDFPMTRLDGSQTTFYEHGDKVIILNFWATWCTYCVKEMPLLDELSKTGKYNIMAVDVGESPEIVQKYIDDNGYTMDVYLDENSELASQFGVTGFPTTIFVNTDFEYLYSFPGMLDEKSLNSILKAIDDYNQ